VDKNIKCLKCSNDAIILAHNRSKPYCEEHFKEYFEKKVFQTIREYKMIKKGEHIAVALSGGKDSSTLLYVLYKLKQKMPFSISAILINEGIKGYRDKALKEAEKLCKKLNIKLYVYSFSKEFKTNIDKISKNKNRYGTCSYCGVFRRYLLNKAAKKIKAEKLALGHNLDDVAQTILLNIIRNEPKRLLRFGLNLKEENKDFIKRIRPLAKLSEIEVATYAIINNLSMHYQDCPYAQEAMRQKVREILNELEDRYPGTKIRIFNCLQALQKEFSELSFKKINTSRDEINKCMLCSSPSSTKICTKCKLLMQLKPKNATKN
jgi:uncharacterized protein (TIGR00269 family)